MVESLLAGFVFPILQLLLPLHLHSKIPLNLPSAVHYLLRMDNVTYLKIVAQVIARTMAVVRKVLIRACEITMMIQTLY